MWLLLALSGAACRSAPPDPEVGAAIAAATGVADAVAFHADPGPLDELPLAGPVLTLAEAARVAVQSDAALQAALAEVRIAEADAEQARLLPNPVLNVQFGWFAGAPWINALADFDLVTALLSGRRSSAADARLRGAAAEAVTAALDLLLDLQTAYVDAQASDALVPMLRERLELSERVLELARARATAGEIAEADVVALEASRIAVQLELDVAERERTQRRLHLARLVGRPNAEADWQLDPLRPVPRSASDDAERIRLALERRPEAMTLRWELAALGDELAIARWDVLSAASSGPLMQQQQGDRAVGPSIITPLPVFDTGAVRERRVELQRAAARHRLLDLQRRVVEDVRVASAAFRATLDCEDRLAGQLLPRLRARRVTAEQAYAAGQTDLTPLLLAEDDLRAAEAKAVQFRQQAATALFQLRRAMGGPEAEATGGSS